MEETISQYIELVLQREPISGEAEGWALLVDNGELTLDQVRQSIIDSAEASTDVYPVILAYQAIYGRVPDANGLNYWVNVYRGVQDLDNPNTPTQNEAMVAILRAFVDPEKTPEFVDRFGPNPTADQFVTLSYKNVLDRVPDQSGQLYWTNRYNQVLEDLEAAHPDWSTEQLNVEVRAIILEQFVSSQEYSESADAAIDGFLNAVALGEDGAHSGSLWSFSGDTFTLTTDADDLTGTDADDTFVADLGSNAGGLAAQQTLQGFDKLDGGEGQDTLQAELNGFDAILGAHNPTITNIEQYDLTVSKDGAHGGVDLARASGYEVLQNINSRGDLTLDNVNLTDGEAPTIAVTNARAGTSTNVNYDTEVGAIETQNVEVSNVGSEDGNVALFIDTDGDGIGTLNLTASNGTNLFFDVDAGGVETLNLDVADGVELVLNDDADGIENLNITGQDELALEGTADFENLVNLNSEEYTGDLELNISGSEVLESVLTGDGDDVITADVDNFGDITTPTTVDLGQGENRLILRDGFSISAGELSSLDFTVNTVDNAQTLELVNVDLNGTASLGLDGVSALETLELRNFDSNGNDLSINGGPDDLTINAISNFTPAADFDMEGGQLTINGVRNLIVNAGDDLRINGGLKGETLETLELNAGDDAGLRISTGFDPNGELDALTSIEVNAGVAEGASNSDAYVRIDDANGSLTTGLTSLESISVAAQDDATLILNGTNNALAGAQTVLADALDAQAEAQTDLADAQADQAAAETALAGAQADQDAKVLDQAAAAAAQAAAQADFDAAEAAQIAAQGVYDAALAADTAADQAVTDANDALATANAAVASFNTYLGAFPFDAGTFTSTANITALNAYILAHSDLTTDQKNALTALVPPVPAFPLVDQPFNSMTEFNAYLSAASTFLILDYDIAGLTNDVNGAVAAAVVTQADLDAADTALALADAALATATSDLATADADLAAADADLLAADAAVATATDGLLDAVVAVDHAEHALDDADAAVIAAQAAVEAALDDGTGFEALETVTVDAHDGDADVELTDVYGAVSLDVTAADNAWVDLYNTAVTVVTATATHVDIDVAGDTVGNGSLTTITVMSATADITLEDNMSSFETLDVSGVSTNLVVDTSGAGFEVDPGMYVEYLLGATEAVDFTGNEIREVYRFDGTEIGNVIITDFTAGADPIDGDRLDLSAFGITGQAGLIFEDVGGNLEITDLGNDDFTGTITLLGVNSADIGFNIIYA